MSLISEINRTETEKNKTKQVAINIDNKLVELGGEQAIDLADVANKMGAMVKTQYKKFATIERTLDVNYTNNTEFTIPLNLDFKPSRILAHSLNSGNGTFANCWNADSKFGLNNKDCKHYLLFEGSSDFTDLNKNKKFYAYIKSYDKNRIVFSSSGMSFDRHNFVDVKIEVICIG